MIIFYTFILYIYKTPAIISIKNTLHTLILGKITLETG